MASTSIWSARWLRAAVVSLGLAPVRRPQEASPPVWGEMLPDCQAYWRAPPPGVMLSIDPGCWA